MRSPAPARFGASRRGAILGAAAGYALMALIVAAIGFPVLWMVLGAFKTSADIYTSPPPLLPSVWRWRNFVDA